MRAFWAFALKRLFNERTLSERARLSAKRIKQRLRAFHAASNELALSLASLPLSVARPEGIHNAVFSYYPMSDGKLNVAVCDLRD